MEFVSLFHLFAATRFSYLIFGIKLLTKKSYDLIRSMASIVSLDDSEGKLIPAIPASDEYPPNLLLRPSWLLVFGAKSAFD